MEENKAQNQNETAAKGDDDPQAPLINKTPHLKAKALNIKIDGANFLPDVNAHKTLSPISIVQEVDGSDSINQFAYTSQKKDSPKKKNQVGIIDFTNEQDEAIDHANEQDEVLARSSRRRKIIGPSDQ